MKMMMMMIVMSMKMVVMMTTKMIVMMMMTFDTPTFNTKEASKLVVFQNARIESSLLASEGMNGENFALSLHAVSSIH